VGGVGEANSDVTQLMPIFRAEADKWPWLMSNLPRFCVEGSVLIFVSRRGLIDELNNTLNASSYPGLFLISLFIFFFSFFFLSFLPFVGWIFPDSWNARTITLSLQLRPFMETCSKESATR